MINKREIKIFIFYLIFPLLMIFSLWIIVVTNYMHKSTENAFQIRIGIIIAFLIIASIAAFIASIYHFIKAFYLSGKRKEQGIILHYDTSLWRKLIHINFRNNMKEDISSLLKFACIFIPIGSLSILFIVIFTKHSYIIFLTFPFIIQFIYFLWVICRNVLKAIDHIIFSDKTIVLMTWGVIMNGEFIYWEKQNKSYFLELNIEEQCVDVFYIVRARTSTKYRFKPEIKKLTILLPVGKHDEVKTFLNDNHCIE